MPPVFVHAWWRASSTWFWAKLRADPRLRCYYEPLHETIATLRPDKAAAPADAKILRMLRHPPIERHYFAEYESLLAAGGLAFRARMAYDPYLLRPADADPALRQYLAQLIDGAAAAGQRAALCFVRSPMRSLWMRRRFPGVHVAQLRNPRDQWASFQLGVGLRTYFVAGVARIAAGLRKRLPGTFPALALVEGKPGGGYAAIASALGARRMYAMFLTLWIASALQGLSAADVVLDCDRLTEDESARRRAREALAAHGIAVDLSDARTPRHPQADAASHERIEARVVAALSGPARALVVANLDRVEAALEPVSAASRPLLEAAVRALRQAPAQRAGMRSQQ